MIKYVRKHGVLQFINRYNEVKDICNDQLLWGDEIEYTVIELDRENRKARIALRAAEVHIPRYSRVWAAITLIVKNTNPKPKPRLRLASPPPSLSLPFSSHLSTPVHVTIFRSEIT